MKTLDSADLPIATSSSQHYYCLLCVSTVWICISIQSVTYPDISSSAIVFHNAKTILPLVKTHRVLDCFLSLVWNNQLLFVWWLCSWLLLLVYQPSKHVEDSTSVSVIVSSRSISNAVRTRSLKNLFMETLQAHKAAELWKNKTGSSTPNVLQAHLLIYKNPLC